MGSRSSALILVLFLSFSVAACSKAAPRPAPLVGVSGTASDVSGTGGSAKQADKQAELPAIPTEKQDPPEVAIGQRLFRETRFNQYFATHSEGRLNQAPAQGDPVLDVILTRTGSLKNPYAGKGMNCASCHLIGEVKDLAGGASRAYNDFAARSPIPLRAEDGRTTTVRNSPAFVNSTLSLKKGYEGHALFLHGDGEFASAEDLVIGGFTGRNFGWLANEAPLAIAHLAKVIREDDGQDRLAQEFGGAYAKVLLGTDDSIPAKFKLPEAYRLDVASATDAQIMTGVAKLVAAYLKSLIYSRDDATGEFNGSAYDAFLKKNSLPRKPAFGETDLAYSRRLLRSIETLPADQIRFVETSEGKLELHPGQPFVFGALELRGLKTFLREPAPMLGSRAGNCIACHAPPAFKDFSFHNTGATQEEYDSIHGAGKFAKLSIPKFAERISRADEFLGPVADRPFAKGKFISIPTLDHPGFTDLGVWNVFGNPSIERPQAALKLLLCASYRKSHNFNSYVPCDNDAALGEAVASFKTPGLRDLGHSAPYLHTGLKNSIEDVLNFYVDFSVQAHQGKARGADVEIGKIQLTKDDVPTVAAFLRSLNEDYH